MELEYVYTKLRNEFGKQCLFSDRPVDLIDSGKSSQKAIRDYIYRNPVNQYSQCSQVFATHTVSTDSAKYVSNSMNHSEGGWPKDINLNDEDQPKRYRRKIEKEEVYVTTVLKLANSIEQSIIQNTSVNIYEHYFTGLEKARPIEKNYVRAVNVYQDPGVVKRPITHISWSPNTSTKLAIAYCDLAFQPRYSVPPSNNSYIWEVENPNMPYQIFKPHVPIVCLEYHVKDTNCLVAGMINGQVSIWDARSGYDYIHCSIIEESHQEPVRSAIWINSKTGSEFFTGSSDGQLKWWDIRKLSTPTETVILDMVRFGEDQVLSRAYGASCVEYEPTIPTRYMVGTEPGYVISGNRKGKNPIEKLVSKIKTCSGPVCALQRNTAYTKIFMTVGATACKIWSEECKDSYIITTPPYRAELTGGLWSPARYSVFYLIRYDGVFDIWDILQSQSKPKMSVKLCEEPLTAMRFHEEGQLAVFGNQKGVTFLVEMSDSFCQNLSHDKVFLGQMFDRETAREKIMEGKLRELRLKSKTKSTGGAPPPSDSPGGGGGGGAGITTKQVAEEFYKIIDEELYPEEEVEPESEPEPEPEPIPEPEPEPILPPKKVKGKKKGKK